MSNESRSPIYAFAECACGGVFQSYAPVDWDAVDAWQRRAHSQSGHEATNVMPPRRVFEWRDGKMQPARLAPTDGAAR